MSNEQNGNGEAGGPGGRDPHRLLLDLDDYCVARRRLDAGFVWLRRSLPDHRPDLLPVFQRVLDEALELEQRLHDTWTENLKPRLMKLRGADYVPPGWLGL